ncbi:glycoside hydrolase family 3 C-terminal domain-containing protein [Sphingomonas sp. LB-2]|uniref:glycoside hydrolase family 3 protein n=1 Tax=Sphingomonas caeni TaxID=2984949 RepID=UPI00223103E0|nr:glycoside hydrolase family 3 protein [Sphingomonas caeni]MCW3846035.1 glycoside hydrolase family 3 C-terminal domain-containing protein [Sphingomonas caeni]
MASFGATGVGAQLPGASLPTYRDTDRPFEARAADLVSRMTLEEKASQLVNDAPAIPRLGIREYNWWNEGLHGVAAAGYATVFPQAIGLAATFDVPHIGQVANLISIEFRAKYLAERHRFGGSDWFGGLTVWSPNINIFRDPRWGRGQETYGEDPWLTAHMGVAFVRGLQGDDSRYLRTVSTPKHFAVHSGPEASRHRDDVHPSKHDLVDTYLPAFRATVMEGGAQSVMCAYNAIDGAPACASDQLLTHYLRNAWNFGGYVVSDCDAVGDIYRKDHHGYSASPEAGVAAAFHAGMDLICGGPEEIGHIVSAVKTGVLEESVVDRSLVRLFTARMRLGQFDDSAKVFPGITAKDYDTEANRALAEATAEKSLVLLKNDKGLLPLTQAPRRIAVIGPNADSQAALVGNYSGEPSHPVTVLSGIKRRFPDAQVTYVEGSGLIDRSLEAVPAAALCVDEGCSRSGVKAETFDNREFKGTAKRSAIVPQAGYDWSGEMQSGAIRWTGYLKAPEDGEYTFRYVANGGYRIWIDGKPVVDAWAVDWRPSIASGKVTLKAGRTYAVRVEAFQRQAQGSERLMWSVPSDPPAAAAVAAAKNADVVIFVGGLTAQLEGEEMRFQVDGFMGGDRTSLDLPRSQQRLLEQVHAAGTPVVLVLMNGSALSVNWADQNIPAIIEAWYPGGQGGDAVARAIAGDFSPAGRLPVTFYRSADDLPAFGDYAMSNRTYRYFKGEALYPFGYGLSYTSFRYSGARVSKPKLRADEAAQVAVDVTNSGSRDGDEVVQLYVSRPGVAGAPIRSLAGVQRVHLAAGETRRVTFALGDRALSIVDSAGVRRIVPGKVDLWVGGGQPGGRAGLAKAAGAQTSFQITSPAILPE